MFAVVVRSQFDPNAGQLTCPCQPILRSQLGCSDACVPGYVACQLYQNNCGSNGIDIVIDRTYKHGGKYREDKSTDECVFPDLDITIDKGAMMALLPVGSQRLIYSADTSETMIDVGIGSEDTQFWFIPTLATDNIQLTEIIDTSLSPFKDSFDDVTRVIKSTTPESPDFEIFNHYKIDDDEMLLLGSGVENGGDPYSFYSFKTVSDFPLQCGLTVDSRSLVSTTFDDDVDSTLEVKTYEVRATGMMTPINEDPVPTLLAEFTLEEKTFKDGQVVTERYQEGFEWFSTKGHRIIGILKPGAPKEGMTTFTSIHYDRPIPACPQAHNLGTDLLANTYRAQDAIQSSGSLLTGPVQFVASQNIDLEPGFNTNVEFSALIDATPCPD